MLEFIIKLSRFFSFPHITVNFKLVCYPILALVLQHPFNLNERVLSDKNKGRQFPYHLTTEGIRIRSPT